MSTQNDTTNDGANDGEDFAVNRHDQLTSAPESTDADAAPRVDVSDHDGTTRIDIRDDAEVRPGAGPGMPEADGE